jgi:hypothetical protein
VIAAALRSEPVRRKACIHSWRSPHGTLHSRASR